MDYHMHLVKPTEFLNEWCIIKAGKPQTRMVSMLSKPVIWAHFAARLFLVAVIVLA